MRIGGRELRCLTTACVFVFFIALALGSNGSSDSSSSGATTVDLGAVVKFNGTQFVITNEDSFDWTNVRFELNSPGLLGTGYVLNAEEVKAGKTYTVGAMQFAKSDGTRFNPVTTKALKFSIWCDTPRGEGHYYGEWK